jgi:hypothetical protein
MIETILGALLIFGGIAALCGKPEKAPKGSWVDLIYQEHKKELLRRS